MAEKTRLTIPSPGRAVRLLGPAGGSHLRKRLAAPIWLETCLSDPRSLTSLGLRPASGFRDRVSLLRIGVSYAGVCFIIAYWNLKIRFSAVLFVVCSSRPLPAKLKRKVSSCLGLYQSINTCMLKVIVMIISGGKIQYFYIHYCWLLRLMKIMKYFIELII